MHNTMHDNKPGVVLQSCKCIYTAREVTLFCSAKLQRDATWMTIGRVLYKMLCRNVWWYISYPCFLYTSH